MCCMWLAEMQDAKNRQKLAACEPSHKFVGLYLLNEGMYRRSERNLLNSNLLQISSQYGELRLTNGWDHWRVWGTPANFKAFRVLTSLLQRRRLPEANQTLNAAWPSPARYSTLSGVLNPDGSLPGAHFTLRANFAFSYIGSITVWHWTSRRQPNFAA